MYSILWLMPVRATNRSASSYTSMKKPRKQIRKRGRLIIGKKVIRVWKVPPKC